jgi:leader peptidase (prepilin peptidase)/N-methyltransferase
VQNYLLAAGFVFGAIIGSFLNVCIYRIPRGISLIDPARSFCPECRRSIPFHLNIPILSWLFLRGRCASCHAPIGPRYLIVEALTGTLFAIAVWRVPLPTVFSIWVILSILIVTTFVDLEFLIIPDVMSKGGIVAGLLLSLLTPGLHNTSSPFYAVLSSMVGGATGALVLYLIGELGKLAFGRYKIALDTPAAFSLESLPNEDLLILIGGESFFWSEHFVRPSDRIVLHATDVEINGSSFQNIDLRFFHDRVVADGETIDLDKIKSLSGHTTGGKFPREAMGFGDIKLVAAIGTFAGWQGALFTIAGGAFVGAAFSIVSIALGQRERSAKIPFGPHLAIAAVIWLFWGEMISGEFRRVQGISGVQELEIETAFRSVDGDSSALMQ